MKHCEVVRQGLSADNDKVFMIGPEASRPFGHYRNATEPDAAPNPEWDLSNNLIKEEQQEVLRAARLIVSGGLAGPPEDPAAIPLENVVDDDDGEIEDDCTEWGNDTEVGAFDDDELLEAAAFDDDEMLNGCD